MPTPTITWAVDADGDWSDTADWSPARLPGASDDVSIDTTDLHTVTHSVGTDTVHSLTVGNDDFVLSGGKLTIATTASFANLLTISGGTLVLSGPGTSATMNNLAWSGGTISVAGQTTVTGSAAITGAVTLLGKVQFGSLQLTGPASLASGSAVNIGARAYLSMNGAGATLAGVVSGQGGLSFEGGTQTLNSGAAIRTAAWTVANDVVTLGENLTYTHSIQLASATLHLNGHTLNLTGPTELSADLIGNGRLITHGATSLSSLSAVVSGSPTWVNYGTVTGGGVSSDTLTIDNESTGVFDLNAGFVNVDLSFINNGLLEKTSGATKIQVQGAVDNLGTLSVSSGSLSFTGAVTGAGGATVVGGTLVFDAAFTGNVDFTGAQGRLALGQSQSYTGAITGFSATGGTSLALQDIGFVNAGEATFSGTATGGILTVTDGTHTAHVALVGDYLGVTFTASKNVHGTNVVATTPSPAHHFIAAMAGMGAAAGAAIHLGDAHAIHAPLLARPHVMNA